VAVVQYNEKRMSLHRILRTRDLASFPIPAYVVLCSPSSSEQSTSSASPRFYPTGSVSTKTLAGEKTYFKILFPQEMGLPMNNLHAPTVPSGPTSGPQGDRSALDRLSLMELISRKDNLEAELKALSSVLDSVSLTALTGLVSRNGH
jgi:hypothetical protein